MDNRINFVLSKKEQQIISDSGLGTEEFFHKAIMNMSPEVLNQRYSAILNIVTATNNLQFCVKKTHLPIVRSIKKEAEILCSI